MLHLLNDHSEMFVLEEAIQQIKQGVMITNYTGQILFVNSTFCDVTGYTPAEVIENKPDFLKSNRQKPMFYEQMWEALYERGYWSGNVFSQKKDGSLLLEWLEVNSMKDERGHTTRFVFEFSDVEKIKKTQDNITFLAYHDPLTKLPNRLYTQQHLQHLLTKTKSEQQIIAVLYLDLDGFKKVNDTLGHAYGDEVLIQAAKRIKNCLKKDDIVSRMGGDEFVCILANIRSKKVAENVAKRIIQSIASPFHLNSLECYISVSIGISFFPYDGDDIETLITYADSAMYRAKNSGKNQYKLAKAEVNAAAFERLVFENGLRRAIEEEALTLHYQPQVDVKTHTVTGFEALLRWEHPDLGTVSPGDFIPIAEETGLIIPIGEWVLRTACKQNMIWQNERKCAINIAVNISTQQFLHKNFVETVLRILDETNMPAHLLELEITETILMHQTATTMSTIQQLRGYGIRISIDDFGTGYSSLHYLKDFPIDTLKIDRSFIKDIDNNHHSEAITSAIITLAHNLNMKVIAEGVETTSQLSKLTEPKCDEIQGFLFSRPIPSNHVIRWMDQYMKHIRIGDAFLARERRNLEND